MYISNIPKKIILRRHVISGVFLILAFDIDKPYRSAASVGRREDRLKKPREV